MKIENQRNTTTFHAGLTKQMQQEIKSCNVSKISKEFSRNGIPTNFKGNKLIAWCCLKCLEIIKSLNQQYNLNLGLPKGICVEDFRKLKNGNVNATGLCNVLPALLYKNSMIVVPEKTIFFNANEDYNYPDGNYEWDKIDEHSTNQKIVGIAPNDFFLETFLHEFAHVIHENHLLNILGNYEFAKRIMEITTPEYKQNFDRKYFNILYRNCCSYATTHAVEAVGCDLSNRIINNLDENKLTPHSNFVENSPYRKYSLKETLLSPIKDEKYDRIIRRFWNGNLK